MSFFSAIPDVGAMLISDAESTSPYVETINPPPSDVVIPVPIVSILPPSLEKVVGNNIDLSAGIVLPVSSLQVPYPNLSDSKPALANSLIAARNQNLASSAKEKGPVSPPKTEETANIMFVASNLIDEAQAKLDNGDNTAALAIFERILAHDRQNHEALAGQAVALQQTGKSEAAVKASRRLLAIDPDNETGHATLVASLGAWGTAPAIKELRQIAKAHPEYEYAQAALVQALMKKGDMLAALPYARRAAKMDPDNLSYQLNLAVLYDRLGHSGEAVGIYHQVLKFCDELDGPEPDLPVSLPAIRQRVGYLEKLMASAENLNTPSSQ